VEKQAHLHVTDGHMAAGSMVETAEKKGSNKGSTMSAMVQHAPSAKTVTLQKQAFPATDRHDPSQEIPEWAMRDSSEYAFDPINIESETVAGCPRVAHGVAPMQLGDAVKLLIERWDDLDGRSKEGITRILKD